MNIGNFDIHYFSHVCFSFTSPAGKCVVTDPFWQNGFLLEDHFETCLSPPSVPVSAIKACDVVFISHIHGDHYDPDTVMRIHRQTRCRILAPAIIVEDLENRGVPEASLMTAAEGKRFEIGDLCLYTYAGYDDATDSQGRPDKFSLVMATGPTRLFYSGDCHELPPKTASQEVAAMFCWAHPDSQRLSALCRGLKTRTFVLMHGDRFSPGRFICNTDFEAEKKRIENTVNGMKVIIPERVAL